MKKIITILAITAIASFACWETTATKSGEYDDAQRNVKVCVYQSGGHNYTYAVGRFTSCPFTVTVCR